MNRSVALFVFCLGMLHHTAHAHTRNDCFEYNQRQQEKARKVAQEKRIARHTRLQQGLSGKNQ